MEHLSINEHIERINESKEIMNLGLRKVNKIELKFIKMIFGITNFLDRGGIYLKADINVDDLISNIEDLIYSPFISYSSISVAKQSLKDLIKELVRGDGVRQKYSITKLLPTGEFSSNISFNYSNNSIFSHKNLTNTLARLDVDKPIYTFLNPVDKKDSQYSLTVYIASLTNTYKNSVGITSDDAKLVMTTLFKNKGWFIKLRKHIGNYTYDNNFVSLHKIIKIVKQQPILTKISKQFITNNLPEVVYRGVKSTDAKIAEADDRAKSFIAVSADRDVSKGFLEDGGTLFTYKIKPSDVLLDIRLLGSSFNEEEIIVNPKNIKLIDTETY